VTKKDLEAEYFERFRHARPDLELAEAEHVDAPDFLIRRPSSVLGVEVTRFSPARDGSAFIPEEQDSLRDRVLELARETYYANGGVPLHLQALFNDYRPISRRRVVPLANELAAFLLAKAISVLLYENVPFSPREKFPFMSEIGSLTAVRVPERSYGVWYGGQAGWVRKADLSDFQRILAVKEPLVNTYRARADEVWLLSVFEMMPGGTHVEVPRSVSFVLPTAFDRVFALERISGFCVEIPVSKVEILPP
jgi:hypothetical protein